YEPTPDLEEEMQLRVGSPMRVVMATPRAVNQGIAQYYPPGVREDVADPIASPGGKPAKGAKGAKAAQPAGPRKPMAQLPPEEQQKRKNIGYLIMMWAVMGSALVDTFVIPEGMKLSNWIPFLPFFLTLIIPPIAIWYVLKVYWK